MSRWFRHYAGMMRDEKLVSVAIRSKQPVERVVWVWGAILESAAEIDDGGRYDVDAAEIAYFLRADQADVDAVMASLAEAGRICEGVVVKWGNRQFSSDRSKDRVAAHRERKRAERGDCNDGSATGNSDVTLQGRHCNSPETDTDTDTEEDSVEPSGSTGADAPKGPSAIDLKAAVFASGVPLLQSTGSTDRNARSMLGRWRSDHGDAAVLDALAAATAQAVSDPIPWIRRRLENGHRANGGKAVRPSPALALIANADEQDGAEFSAQAHYR